MSQKRHACLLALVALTASAARAEGEAQAIELTLEQALVLARRQAPTLRTARAGVTEARAALEDASVWPFNPQLEVAAGPRLRPGSAEAEWSVGASQRLELGGRRGHRMAASRADVEAAQAQQADFERRLLGEVAGAFVRSLHARRRLAIADENVAISEEIARIAERRRAVGEAGDMDAALGAVAVLQAQAESVRADASLTEAIGVLKVLLGLPRSGEIVLEGNLRHLALREELAELPLEPDEATRPDLRALTARIRAAEAEAEAGRAKRLPNLTLGARYGQEEAATIVQGTLGVTLPFFDHGQGIEARAEARSIRLASELTAAQREAGIRIDTAATVARRLSAAAQRFEDVGLDLLVRAERLGTASYRLGATPLAELLAVRRELLLARRDHAQLLLEAALARVALTVQAGGWE